MRALIFDFDGTIADSFEASLAIFEDITRRPQKLSPKEVSDLRGKSLKEIIKYLKIKPWQIPRLVIKAKREMASKIPSIKDFDGMPASIKQLHGQNYQLFILSTNSRANISLFLKNEKLDKYFSKIYGDIGLRRKSSVIKKMMKKEKIDPGQCFYIGDETRDIDAAKKAGVTSVAVGWGFNYPAALKRANPDFLVEKPSELPKIFK